MTIKRFGQAVKLEVLGPDRTTVIFDSDGLRVDFDIVNIPGFARGTFKIWNLTDNMVKQIQHGERYCRLTATLHDDTPMVLADGFFISNAFEQTIVPNSVTNIFGYSVIRKDLLNKQIKFTVENPSLKNIMTQVVQETKFKGKVIYRNFPGAALEYLPPRFRKPRTGSVEGLLDTLKVPYRFKYFTIGEDIVLMYQPTADNLDQTDLVTAEADIVLDSNNLGASPKIGPGQLVVECNLDGDIKPTSILDISNIVTAAPDADDITLQLAPEYLKQAIAGFTKYQALTVQHRGSNFTGQWDTIVTASSPTKGKDSPIRGWNV
jgi:hypothetical protein